MADKSPEEQTEKLFELVDDIKVAMLTTAGTGGTLHSRPMWVRRRGGDQAHLYCFTSDKSGKIGELGKDSQVNLSFADTDDQEYVSVSGRASVTEDRALIDDLWGEGARAWFPKGKDDPDLAVLEIAIEAGEYWDAPNGLMVTAYGYAKARLTGKTPGDPAGDHGTIGRA